MHNVLVYQLPQYYQPQQIPITTWTALVTWYTCYQLAYTKILQNKVNCIPRQAKIMELALLENVYFSFFFFM